MTTAPRVANFVQFLEKEISEAINLFKNIEDKNDSNLSEKHKSAINFIQTVLSWFISYLSRSLQPIKFELLRLVPLLCSLDNIAAQEDTMKQNLNIVRSFISIWNMDANCASFLMDQLNKV